MNNYQQNIQYRHRQPVSLKKCLKNGNIDQSYLWDHDPAHEKEIENRKNCDVGIIMEDQGAFDLSQKQGSSGGTSNLQSSSAYSYDPVEEKKRKAEKKLLQARKEDQEESIPQATSSLADMEMRSEYFSQTYEQDISYLIKKVRQKPK